MWENLICCVKNNDYFWKYFGKLLPLKLYGRMKVWLWKRSGEKKQTNSENAGCKVGMVLFRKGYDAWKVGSFLTKDDPYWKRLLSVTHLLPVASLLHCLFLLTLCHNIWVWSLGTCRLYYEIICGKNYSSNNVGLLLLAVLNDCEVIIFYWHSLIWHRDRGKGNNISVCLLASFHYHNTQLHNI